MVHLSYFIVFEFIFPYANLVELKAIVILIVGVIHYGNQSPHSLDTAVNDHSIDPLPLGIALHTVPEGIHNSPIRVVVIE